MKIIYVPKREANESLIPGIDTALALLIPDKQLDKYFFAIFVHGVGERSNGKLDNLKNLVEGFDWDGDGVRDWGFVTADMKKAVDQYNIIIAIPTYEDKTFFEPAKVNWVYDYVKARYPIYDKMMLGGFSLGGGVPFKYATSSLANAQRMALGVPVAGVTSIISGGKNYPAQAGSVFHAFSCNEDPQVSSSNTVSQVNTLNSANPAVKAQYTFFKKRDHSIEGAWNIAPPVAPGGEGVINAAENIYDLFTDIVKTGKPRQIKTGTIVPVPPPEPNPQPATLKAEFNITDKQVVTTPVLDLDASASTGVYSGWDAYVWDVRVIKGSAPKSYDVRPESVYDNDAKNKLTNIVDGEYSITLTVRDAAGNKASKTVTIIAAVTGKIATGFNSVTDIITYSDGTTEKGTAIFGGGNWVVKNSAGQVVEL